MAPMMDTLRGLLGRSAVQTDDQLRAHLTALGVTVETISTGWRCAGCGIMQRGGSQAWMPSESRPHDPLWAIEDAVRCARKYEQAPWCLKCCRKIAARGTIRLSGRADVKSAHVALTETPAMPYNGRSDTEENQGH